MALSGNSTNLPPTTGPPPHEFRGHPQPPADERLTAAFNFLADEDPDRCLDFASRIKEIEDYVEHVEKQNITCSVALLNDVKVMAAAHRDWEKRRADGPPDVGCNDNVRPLISTRLVSAEIAAGLRFRRDAAGLNAQIREDHTPFSVNRESDHTAFIEAMNEDAKVDPDELDPTRNLLVAESRAYCWALQDPIMIPTWMHPTQGIPKKGVSAADTTPWYRTPVPDPVPGNSDRPARGWVPGYLLAREETINSLLKKRDLTADEMMQLEDLLHFVEPPELGLLHAENAAFDKDERLGLVTDEEKPRRQQIASEYATKQAEWMNFSDVYFIVRTPTQGTVEVDQPGVFYVDHGVQGDVRASVLRRANELLQTAISDGLKSMSPQDLAAIEVFLQHSQPVEITNDGRRRAAILRKAGANSRDVLINADQQSYDDLYNHETNLRSEWLASIAPNNPEFRYLRPGEMDGATGAILYIPWEIVTIPTVQSPILVELALPPQVQKLQDDLNRRLQSPITLHAPEEEMRLLLQVAYPALRALSLPWLAWREQASRNSLSPQEARLKLILDPIFAKMFTSWLNGLTRTTVTVKIPHPDQQPEGPGILYWRNNLRPNPDPTADIQRLLDIGQGRTVAQNSDLQKHLRLFQYPALQRAYDDYAASVQLGASDATILRNSWLGRLNRWIRSMEGSMLKIKRWDPHTDPDNDPAVVYYHGPLQSPSYAVIFPDNGSMLLRVVDSMKAVETFILPAGDAPAVVRDAFNAYTQSQSAVNCVLYAWHLLSWYRDFKGINSGSSCGKSDSGYLSGQFDDETFCGPDCIAPDTSPTFSETAGDILHVDLSPLLPQIKALETEINRIAEIIRTSQTSPDFQVASPRVLTEALMRKFDDLLKQFMPCDVHQLFDRRRRYKLQIMKADGSIDPSEKDDFDSMTMEAVEAFTEWRKVIVSNGAEIRISPLRSYDARRTPLTFMSHTTGKGVDFQITAPAPSGYGLATYKLPPVPQYNPTFTHHQLRDIATLELSINGLLSKRSDLLQPRLTWDESELLLSNLRAVMPLDIAAQDEEHRALDLKARNGIMSSLDNEDFWVSWENWTFTFENWIKSFPGPGGTIKIAIGAPNEDPNTMTRLRIMDLSNLEVSRPRNPPHVLIPLEADLNKYLYGNAVYTVEERQKMEFLLFQFFAPIRFEVRRLHLNNIHVVGAYPTAAQVDPGQAIPTAELAIFVDVLESLCCILYRDALKALNTKKVTIEEVSPGDFRLVHDSILPGGDPQIVPGRTTRGAREREIALSLSQKLWNNFFSDTRLDFLTLASKVRRLYPLSVDETTRLQTQLLLLGRADLQTMQVKTDLIAKLADKASRQGDLVVSEKYELIQADLTYLWYRWVLSCLDPSHRLLVNPPIPNLITRLLTEGIQTLPRSTDLPSAEPPSKFEVKELETEINNLLMKERTNKATKQDVDDLEFLLRELLTPALRLLKIRIDRQEEGSVNLPFSSINSGLALLEEKKGFRGRYSKFKKDLPVFGIILDTWWYSQPVINAACSRWRSWKSMCQNPDGSPKFPATNRILDNERQRQLLERYHALEEYTRTGCPQDIVPDTKLRLLLSVMPQSLSNLQDQIQNTTSALKAGDADQGSFLQGIKEEFIKSYMQWYTTRTPGQLQALKKGATEADGDKVDFTGKAERRGIQRAAIELALNLLATNQEQHRPGDRFRIVNLTHQYVPLEKEFPISLPLEPSRRQIDQDTFEYTKKMVAFRQWKDFDYEVARDRVVQDTSSNVLYPPINYVGPFALANAADDMEVARDRHAELSRIALRLSDAYTNAPRPILQRMLQLVTEGMDKTLSQPHYYYDEVPLNKFGLDILEEISGDSWEEGVQEHVYPLPDFSHDPTKYAQERDRLVEFEKDIAELQDLPLWVPVQEDQDMGGNGVTGYRQTPHDPAVASRHGLSPTEILLRLGKMRATRADRTAPARFLSESDIHKFLVVMKQSGRIHYDENPGDQRASRIPLEGHPENKYVLSRDGAGGSPGVRADAQGKLSVQYNASGVRGPPIVQPNKIDFLERLAFRLGRDTLRVLERLQTPVVSTKQGSWAAQDISRRAAHAAMARVTPVDRGQAVVSAMVAPDSITIQRLAREANSVAPYHASAAGITVDDTLSDRDAAAIIQMKILEESSNNFEPKFREKENVWDFASDRLVEEIQTVNGRKITVRPRITQYFSMRRFPVCYQSEATRMAISQSGPTLEDKTAATVTPDVLSRTQVRQKNQLERKARHIRGQVPYYPFGETPYQEAYHSHVMEHELRDVPEFQPPPPRRSLFNPFGRAAAAPIEVAPEPEEDPPIPNDPYPLPEIPPGWTPDNISIEEKRLQVTEIARNTDGFPSRAIPEYYYTHDEIKTHRAMHEYTERTRAIQAATEAIENLTRKKHATLSMQELRNAHTQLNIDPLTGTFLPNPNVRLSGGVATPATKMRRTGGLAPTRGPTTTTTTVRYPPPFNTTGQQQQQQQAPQPNSTPRTSPAQASAPSADILPAINAGEFDTPPIDDFLSRTAQDEAHAAIDLGQKPDVLLAEDLASAAGALGDAIGVIADVVDGPTKGGSRSFEEGAK